MAGQQERFPCQPPVREESVSQLDRGQGSQGRESFVFRLQISGLYLISFSGRDYFLQDQNNAMVAQYIYLKISENCCCPAVREDQCPIYLPETNQLLCQAP